MQSRLAGANTVWVIYLLCPLPSLLLKHAFLKAETWHVRSLYKQDAHHGVPLLYLVSETGRAYFCEINDSSFFEKDLFDSSLCPQVLFSYSSTSDFRGFT